QRLPLRQNFRSVPSILRWANHHFEQHMKATPGIQPPYVPLDPAVPDPTSPVDSCHPDRSEGSASSPSPPGPTTTAPQVYSFGTAPAASPSTPSPSSHFSPGSGPAPGWTTPPPSRRQPLHQSSLSLWETARVRASPRPGRAPQPRSQPTSPA